MTITPLPDPLPCSSGYTIHAYCRYNNPKHEWHKDRQAGSEEFFGRNEREAREEARLAGWCISKGWMATCPLCSAELKQRKQSRKTLEKKLERLKADLDYTGQRVYSYDNQNSARAIAAYIRLESLRHAIAETKKALAALPEGQ